MGTGNHQLTLELSAQLPQLPLHFSKSNHVLSGLRLYSRRSYMLVTTLSVAAPLVPLSGFPLSPLSLHSQMAQAEHHPRAKPYQRFPGISGALYSHSHICLLNFALTEVLTLTSCSFPTHQCPSSCFSSGVQSCPPHTLEHH